MSNKNSLKQAMEIQYEILHLFALIMFIFLYRAMDEILNIYFAFDLLCYYVLLSETIKSVKQIYYFISTSLKLD